LAVLAGYKKGVTADKQRDNSRQKTKRASVINTAVTPIILINSIITGSLISREVTVKEHEQ